MGDTVGGAESLFHRLDRTLVAAADRVCLETPGGARVTYGALRALSGRMARCLRDRGVGPDDRLAVQVEKSIEAVALYLASLRLGAVYLPLNPAYRSAEVGYFCDDAEPSAVVATPEREAELRGLLPRTTPVLTLDTEGAGTLIDGSAGLDPELPAVPRRGGDVAAILYTSGTTGRAKGAMLTHRNLLSNAETLVDQWRFSERDVLLHALPIYHVHGLFVALHCVLLSGARALFLPAFEVAEVLPLLSRATVMMGVPTYYTRLLESRWLSRQRCRRMRLFISGSAPLRRETFEAFRARTGQAILERYGMTEAGMICSNPLDGERLAGTVGWPLPGVETRVVDADGNPVGDGAAGMLAVRGPNLFAGYWRRPEKTVEEHTADGFFLTGDLVTRDADGRMAIVGRAKDLVISGGLNVYPKEVETALDAIDAIAESAVIGVPHPDLGEAVVAVAVRAAGHRQVTADAVRNALRPQLAGFKVPKQIHFVDQLPRNAMGKVQKNVLRNRLAAVFG